MAGLNHRELAEELLNIKPTAGLITRPSAREENFSMDDAYAVGFEIAGIQKARGRKTVGRKIGFTNPALWERMGLDAVIWSYVYDNTLQHASNNKANYSLKGTAAPKIEPEIVFKLKSDLTAGSEDAASILETVEWVAFGYEIVDCNYANWRFKPADMVADFGFHAGLIVGEPHPVKDIGRLVSQLQGVKVKLFKNEELAAEGAGKNVMGSPALSLGSVAGIISRQKEGGPLAAGEIITSGTLTEAQPVTPGETWRTELEGLDLPPFSITFTG